MKRIKKIALKSTRVKYAGLAVFAAAFAGIGGFIIYSSKAAPGVCSTSDVVGSSSHTISIPEAGQYRLWVRMQVPDTANATNINGVRVEITGASNQCFTTTTTASNAVNAWQWINSDATAASTAHVTSQLASGNYTVRLLGLKAGVKVDRVLLLAANESCTPSNTVSGSVMPGDNCTTPVATATLSAGSTSLQYNTGTTITWGSTNATGCVASGGNGSWAGNKNPSGTFNTGNLTTSQTYTIICNGVGGQSTSRSVTVNVASAAAPSVSFSASPTSVVTGSPSTLTWQATNATSCTGSGGSSGWAGSKAVSGSQSTGNLTSNQTFNLSCTGPGGTTQATAVTVTVTAAPSTDTQKPNVTMNVVGVTIPSGQSSVLVTDQASITWRPLTSDNVGVTFQEFRVNGQVVSLTNGAYTFGNQRNGNGDYILRVVARDARNNTEDISITIRLRHPDINRDGNVDSSDFNGLLRNWGTQSTNYDLNGRDGVNSSDFNTLLRNWGPVR